MEHSPGLMAENISDNILMIKKKGKGTSSGLMEDNIEVNGRMVNSTELVYI